MTAYYLKSGSGAAEFVQSTLYAIGSPGDRMVPKVSDAGANYLVARRWVWECTSGGTTAAAEPTWPAAVTQDVTTVTSGGATFTARRPGYSSGTTADWTFAAIFLNYLAGAAASGDVVYVSNNHNESYGAAISVGTTGVAYVCVDDAAAPPTATATTAQVATAGDFALNAGANTACYFYGIKFTCGVGSAANLTLSASGHIFEECDFILATTNASARISPNGSWDWINCDVKFAHASQGLQVAPGWAWKGGALLAGGTSPTSLIATYSGVPRLIENIDLSNAAAGINIASNNGQFGVYRMRNSKPPASWSGDFLGPASGGWQGYENFSRTGITYGFLVDTFYGSVVHETALVKTGGASDGITALSWKFVSTASALYPHQAITSHELVRWNDTTGSPITVSVDILRDSATGLTDKEIWIEVQYFSEAGSTLGGRASSMAGYLATAATLTASTATWTTTGMANPNTQKMSVTFTPQLKGFIHAAVKLAKASTTVYVDPVLQLS